MIPRSRNRLRRSNYETRRRVIEAIERKITSISCSRGVLLESPGILFIIPLAVADHFTQSTRRHRKTLDRIGGITNSGRIEWLRGCHSSCEQILDQIDRIREVKQTVSIHVDCILADRGSPSTEHPIERENRILEIDREVGGDLPSDEPKKQPPTHKGHNQCWGHRAQHDVSMRRILQGHKAQREVEAANCSGAQLGVNVKAVDLSVAQDATQDEVANVYATQGNR